MMGAALRSRAAGGRPVGVVIRRAAGGGTKYAPLVAHLAAQRASSVACTFAMIEGIVGFPLPRTARTVAGFWTDRPRAHVRAWEAAGWRARLDFPGRRVVFRSHP